MSSSDRAGVLGTWEHNAGRLAWIQPWRAVYDPEGPGHGAWFPGGRLNLATNAVDRHLPGACSRVALRWEGEPGERRAITYGQLHEDVVALADGLRAHGVRPGDRVALYLGLVPEAVVAMLACARIGAVYAVLPAVLPTEALSDRLRNLGPDVLITQDGAWRHGVMLPLKSRVDEALTAADSVQHTVVVRRTGIDVSWYEGDRWYHELIAAPRPGTARSADDPVAAGAEDPVSITYLADRRGRPTGVVHRTGGLAVSCHSVHVDGLTASRDDVLWAPSELGWLACQNHGILGPLLAGDTAVIYEGMLDTPTQQRAWEIIARYGVTSLLATPSVVRALRRWGRTGPDPDQVATLRYVVTAGEPVDASTARWLRDRIAGPSGRVADAWGQTELGGVVTVDPPVAGADGLPSADLDIVDEAGETVPTGTVGDLVLRNPWPGTTLGVHRADEVPGLDPGRPGLYVTGDRASRRPDGSIRFLGRADAVFSVSGQLVSATEVAAVLSEHPFIAEAVVTDRPDPRRGRAVVACVTPTQDTAPSEELAGDLRRHVRTMLGGLAEPRVIAFALSLPEADPDPLREAVRSLCATATRTVTVTQEQIEAVLPEE